MIRRLSWLRVFVLLLALGAVVAVAGCKGVTPIRQILDDPSHFENKTVRIAGHVTDAAGLLGYGTYRVDDGTGSILVLTTVGGSPREGANVAVEGFVRSAFTVGTTTATVLMESRRETE